MNLSDIAVRPLCIYHKNCMDGLAAAWVVWDYFKGAVDLLAAQYGDELPPDSELKGRSVFVVDFSYNREQVLRLREICELVILDHHETAAKELEGLVHVDQSHSGAMLTWNYFHPDKAAPQGLLFIQDRDLWQWRLRGSKQWTTAAFSYPLSVEHFNDLVKRPIGEVILEGTTLLRKHEQDIEKIAKSVRMMTIDGVEVPVINANALFASDLGHLLSQDHEFAVIYVDSKEERQFSLRSQKGKTNVNEVAERFGGGGHKGAAGFRIHFDDPRFARSHLELNSHDV